MCGVIGMEVNGNWDGMGMIMIMYSYLLVRSFNYHARVNIDHER